MASIAKWATPGTTSGNIASTALDSLANGSSSAGITLDNSTARALYGDITIELGSFTSTAGASITVEIFVVANGVTPDLTPGAGISSLTLPISVGASAKAVTFPGMRLRLYSLRIVVTNNAGAAFASSGNTLACQLSNEEIEEAA